MITALIASAPYGCSASPISTRKIALKNRAQGRSRLRQRGIAPRPRLQATSVTCVASSIGEVLSASPEAWCAPGAVPLQASPAQPLTWLNRAFLAALWPDSLEYGRAKLAEVGGYLQMARLINLLPSCLLVLLGAWAGTGRQWAWLHMPLVYVMSAVSGGVAVASVVVNDYFDYASGVDGVNAPEKPLPSGVVPPDGALLLSFSIYVIALITACLMERPLLRLTIALSAAATLLYTPLLKRVTLLKNATVAAIVAASPMAGALAAGAGGAGLRAALWPSAFAFLGVLYRELLMDVNDVEGDAAAGVRTLPVVLGRKGAMRFGFVLLTAASALGTYLAWTGSGLVWAWSGALLSERLVRCLAAAAVLLTVRPLVTAALSIKRHAFPKAEVKAAIDDTLKTIGLGMLLLACMA